MFQWQIKFSCSLTDSISGHFYFAKYVDAILRSRIIAILRKSPEGRSRESDDILDGFVVAHDRACQRYILLAIKHYVEALIIDIRHVYQALPRLLSLWFEFTSIGSTEQSKYRVYEEPTAQGKIVLGLLRIFAITSNPNAIVLTQNQEEANAVIATKYKQIPVPAFYTALPQLISRVKHPNSDTTTVVHGIVRRVLTKYPAQAMWPLAWLRQSRQHDRQKAGNEIFREAELRLAETSNRLHLLLVESKSLFEWLQKLAKFEPKKARCTEIKVTPWKGQIGLEEFIPPVKAALSASFSIGDSERSRDLFPRHVPRMRAFSSTIKVMQSKARPKILKAHVVSADSLTKIKERTSSGCFDIGEIHFLVKQEAKGDLRKDARVQELNNVVNRLLVSTAGRTMNQRRPLRIRTFAVTCLSEDTGILEWVPDTSSFRSLIGKAFNPQVNTYTAQRRGARLANLGDPVMRKDYERCQEMFFVSKNLKAATKMFEELCLSTNPPLLFWWFVHAFENSNAWYEARTRFTRSSAAWAAIGHVLGVGDRHAENILVDTSNGECVHVDFDW
jgi:serine/threonine-protein kinase ATR